MKSTLRCFFRKLGIRVRRVRPTPYEHLVGMPRYQPTTVKLLGKPFELADAASFYASYREIFVDGIYRFTAASESPLIIDCGANYGTSVVYFKHLYPNAKILAVEADPRIFALLRRNIESRGYSDVRLLNFAVSDRKGTAVFHHEGADGGRLHLLDGSVNTYQVNTVCLDELIEGRVDFLKMDIEGAEADTIHAARRLSQVDQMFVEYHSFKDDRQQLGRMLSQLSTSGFRYHMHTQFCSPRPLTEDCEQAGMDLQLNIFARQDV